MQGIVLITKTGGVIAEESEREQEKRLFQSKILPFETPPIQRETIIHEI